MIRMNVVIGWMSQQWEKTHLQGVPGTFHGR